MLFSEEEIASRVAQLGEEISRDYEGKSIVLVGVLKGCFVFMADLCRKIHSDDMSVHFMQASSYGSSTETSGDVKIVQDLKIDVSGKNVLIAEDILDSGITLSYIKDLLLRRGAASVRICTMFSKPSRHRTEISADYVGFEIPNEFAVGYGLDVDEKYRNLPYLAAVEEEKFT